MGRHAFAVSQDTTRTKPKAKSVIRMRRLKTMLRRLHTQVDGGVFVEYLLLVTIVGIGVIAGLAAVRVALLNELNDLAQAIYNLN